MHALVVDDDRQILSTIERVLIKLDYRVHAVESAAAAIAVARNRSFELAVVDYDLGDGNGVDVLSAIRILCPGCVNILASGALDLDVVTAAVNQGDVSRVLAKPFEVTQLISAIEDVWATRKRQVERYISTMSESSRLELEAFDHWIAQDLVRLALQPIVYSQSGDIHGHECLLRVNHEQFSGAEAMLSVAERQGRLSNLSDVTMHHAEMIMKHLMPDETLFVNLHPLELADTTSLVDRIKPLAACATPIVFELTEHGNVGNIKTWRESLDEIKALGFQLAIDDIGAGYSSLSAIAQVKPDYLKIDRSLVRYIDQDSHKQEIVKLLVKLASTTDAMVIAEGIEREEEGSTIRQCGVDFMQGYLFGKPEIHEKMFSRVD